MKRLLMVLLWGMLLVGCQSPSSAVKSATEHKASFQQTVVSCDTLRVQSSYTNEAGQTVTGHGTGFAVQHDGNTYVITAAHVIDNPQRIYLFDENRAHVNFTIKEIVKLKTANSDVFVMKMSFLDERVKRYEIATATADKKVECVGYPEAGDLFKDSGPVLREVINFDCQVRSGMSGGPLIQDGKVIGVVTGYTESEAKTQGNAESLSLIMHQIK